MSRHNPLRKTSRTQQINRRFPLRELLILLVILALIAGAVTGIVFAVRGTDAEKVPDKTVYTGTAAGTSADTDTDVTTDLPSPENDPALLRDAAERVFAGASFTAKHVVVYLPDADTVLYEKDADASITAASTTKLLTALTALDYISANTRFTVGGELSLVGSNSSTAGLKRGQTLTAEQILEAMLLPSGNDAAYVLAVHAGRTMTGDPEASDKEALEQFILKMNEKAASLGAEHSLFTCPDGYPGGEQHTTASDMMKIAAAALNDPEIAACCGKIFVSYTLNDGTVAEWTNTNQLLQPSSRFYYEGAIGMKTGYTAAAGNCVIGAARVNGVTVIAAIYGAPTSDDRWNDCRTAFGLAFDTVEQAREEIRGNTPNN